MKNSFIHQSFSAGGTLLLNCILIVALSCFFQFANAQCNCTLGNYGCSPFNQGCLITCAFQCHGNNTACTSTVAISASDSLTFCSGDSVTLTAYRAYAAAYQWMNDSGNIAGATSTTYVAHTSGNYKCKVTTSCNYKFSASLTISAESQPTVSLSANGPLSFCNGDSVTLTANTNANKYHWRKNGVDIAGATNASYTVKTEGTYKCRVTNSCGKKRSQGITVTVPCRSSNEEFTTVLDKLFLSPNPVSDLLTIQSPVDEDASLQIINALGQLIYSFEIVSEETKIDTHLFPDGMYWVIVKSDEGIFENKFLKQ